MLEGTIGKKLHHRIDLARFVGRNPPMSAMRLLFICVLGFFRLLADQLRLVPEVGEGGLSVGVARTGPGLVVLEQSFDPIAGDWKAVDARALQDGGKASFERPTGGLDRAFFRAMGGGARPWLVRYVNAEQGSDSNDGSSESTSFKTIARAVADIPPVLAAGYEIRMAPGIYEESIEILRSGGPADLSPEDIFNYPARELPLVAFVGPPGGGAVLKSVAGKDSALRLMNISAHLKDVRVEATGMNAVTVSGGTIVAENLQLACSTRSRAGLFLHRSTLYLGGTNSIEGPFATGISLRTYSLARPGTRDFPQAMRLTIDGVSQALFLRDFSTFTSTFNSSTVRVRNADFAVYCILGSNIFFTGGAGEVFLDVENVRTVFHLTHRSEANVHNLRVSGLRDHFCVGTIMSIVWIEEGIVPPNLIITNLDSTCALRIPESWGARVPAR